jgi:hypothetical protein
MVWQRAGTVSVQNGSTTVTGAGVDFAASSRVGDSFVGPDGATYEVANVASSTVISILPAYKGATVSGAAYAIMPVQGYDKMLSDAFNSLNNQFGPKLAALGTTGNYEILPIDKGGTGATSAPASRLALGVDVTMASAVLDPQTAGGIMSSAVVSGFTVEKFVNGLIRISGNLANTPTVAANTAYVNTYTIPSGSISQAGMFATVTLAVSASNDHYGCTSSVPQSATTIQLVIKNGPVAQFFGISISVWGRWK